MILTVRFAYNDSGNCRTYYRAVSLTEGENVTELNLLVCKQEESEGVFEWYRCTSSGDWEEEPEAVLKRSMRIVSIDGTVLRRVARRYIFDTHTTSVSKAHCITANSYDHAVKILYSRIPASSIWHCKLVEDLS